MLTCLPEHVPVPLIDLTLLQPCFLVQLLDLLLRPLSILLVLGQENLVLHGILAETFLGLLDTLGFVTNDDFGFCLRFLLFRVLYIDTRHRLSWTGTDRGGSIRSIGTPNGISSFLGASNCGSVLFEGCFGSLEQKGIDTLVEVI